MAKKLSDGRKAGSGAPKKAHGEKKRAIQIMVKNFDIELLGGADAVKEMACAFLKERAEQIIFQISHTQA